MSFQRFWGSFFLIRPSCRNIWENALSLAKNWPNKLAKHSIAETNFKRRSFWHSAFVSFWLQMIAVTAKNASLMKI